MCLQPVLAQQPASATREESTNYLPCTLDCSTQALIKLIFNNDMFNDALKNLEIGTYEES